MLASIWIATSIALLPFNKLLAPSHLLGARAIAHDPDRNLAFIASSSAHSPLITVVSFSPTWLPSVVGVLNFSDSLQDARGIAYDTKHHLAYVSSRMSNCVAAVDLVDPSMPKILSTLRHANMLIAPSELVLDTASRHVFVAGESSASLLAINVSDSTSLTVTGTIQDTKIMQGARGVAYDATSRRVFVASRSSHSVASVDASNLSSLVILAALIDAINLRGAEGVTCTQSGHVLVASHGTGSLSVIQTNVWSRLAIIGVLKSSDTRGACAVVYDPTLQYAIMALEEFQRVVAISVVNPASPKMVSVMKSEGMDDPRGLCLDVTRRHVLIVAKRLGSLTVVSLSLRQIPDHANVMDKVRSSCQHFLALLHCCPAAPCCFCEPLQASETFTGT
jgi:DNA-binding beta-propeller fold protein YncE